jgi:hypothetical protein
MMGLRKRALAINSHYTTLRNIRIIYITFVQMGSAVTTSLDD